MAALKVTAVVPRSAAALAGLEPGDVILAVDGESVAAAPGEVVAAFGKRIRGRGAGAKVTLSVRRPTVSVQTYLDEEPEGEPRDGSGSDAARRVLPDLARLLEQEPGKLVTVRARRFDRERDVEVTLQARPGAKAVDLPDNSTLRPQLDGRHLDPAGALAERVLRKARHQDQLAAEQFAALLERYERDEANDDAFRLATVRYLHRAPLRLPLATRGLGVDLRRTFLPPGGDERGGLAAALEVARFHLDAGVATDGGEGPRMPEAGASPADHAEYALTRVRAAELRVERAFARLADDERKLLLEHLPVLAEQFAAHIYLHVDEDPDRRARHLRAVELLEKVNRGDLLAALQALSPLADPTYLSRLRADLLAAEQAGTSEGGSDGFRGKFLLNRLGDGVMIGGSQENEYRKSVKVLIDLGGDDRYHHGAGAGRPEMPAAVCIDLGGDDRYQSTEPFAQGSGFFGVGMLVDVSGRDHYTSSRSFAQGSALAGAGLLLDLAGDDVYRGTSYAQGSALAQGAGLLVDLGGDDHVRADLYSQGFAGPGSFGALLAKGGNDRYAALGGNPCSYGDPGTYRGMSQGSSVGFRHLASGGVAVLLDEGGQDTYEAGNFSQGGGYYFGWGALIDLGGEDDLYEGSRYAQAFSAHSALGSLWEDGGNDRYRGWVGAQLGAAWDLSVAAFLEDGGDDRYEPGRGFSLGASAHNGFALFLDKAGSDTYRIAPGRAGPNDYHGGPSLSVFVDAGGGADTYRGGGLLDDRGSVKPELGVVLDLPVPAEDAGDEQLDLLLTPRGP